MDSTMQILHAICSLAYAWVSEEKIIYEHLFKFTIDL